MCIDDIDLHYISPCTFTRWRQGNHFVRDPAVNLTKIHGLEFIKWVGQEAWCDSPANTGEPKQKKTGALQNACPKFISRPQTQSSYKLVSYKMVGLEICLTCTCPTFRRKPRNLFSKKHVFYKMAWLTRKESLQNASVCYKNAPGMEHGSSHFIVEIYTGIIILYHVHII